MIDRFLSLNKKIKLSVILFGLGLIGLCLILVSQSYAIFFGTTTDSNDQIVKLGSLEVILNEPSTGIDLGLSLMSDVDGLLQKDVYSFTVENTGSANAKYKVLLIDDEASKASYTGTLLDKGLIKIGLVVNGKEKGPFTLSELNELLNEKELKSGKKDTYKLRLWISDKADIDKIVDQQIFLKLKLEAEQYFSEIVINNLDKSGANTPALLNNMIPVYYDSSSNSWKKADSSNADVSNQWYNYDSKMWANAVTVSDTNREKYLNGDVGTVIPMDDINTMWVWIPRYTYTYLNTNTPQEIKIKFEEGIESTGTIKCTDTVTGTSSTSETCTDSTNGSLIAGTSTYTHPAFTFGDQELTGIWVGKFEVSSDITCTASDYSAVGSGCNLQTIRPNIKPNVISWRGAQIGTFFNGIQKMTESGNKYGFSDSDDTHMMKNMEWGAVTYLSHSKYEINKEVALNSVSTYTTGCGPQSSGSTSGGTTCNSYTTVLGQSASTTGNIYGVYDMNGGSWEHVMGDLVYSDGQMMSGYRATNNNNSAFTGYLYNEGPFTGKYAFPVSKYYDKYSYGTSETEYTRGKLGDATKEMVPTGTTGNWYSDYASFPYSYNSWFVRGGNYDNGSRAGLFVFYTNYGNKNTTFNSTRAVLTGTSVLD